MFLKNISINQFKSHEQLYLEIENGINIFCGKNGIGKTNILDAVYVLLNGKSYFLTPDNICIKQGENFFMLKGNITNSTNSVKLQVSFQQGKRKVIKCDEKPFEKIAAYFGKFPCVMIAPGDIEIINGDSENRRIFFDYLFSVIDRDYLQNLVLYQKALENRNRQLKLFIEKNIYDEVIIEYYDNLLEKYGNFIFNIRTVLTNEFKDFFEKSYDFLNNGKDKIQFTYTSGLQNVDFKDGLKQSNSKDRILGRTSFGIHRDDWVFELNNMTLKKTGSQGQIKTYLISLKMAMYDLIYEKKAIKPILLLDDIFEKIDNDRTEKLIQILEGKSIGQVFITDTSKNRVEEIFKRVNNIKITEL
ncbi:MAG: DNA replication and repair protein RecF [Bacteroidetes bacterium]|nr:DNA replication and repair protein RecF [Bacteroidota bacterium]